MYFKTVFLIFVCLVLWKPHRVGINGTLAFALMLWALIDIVAYLVNAG